MYTLMMLLVRTILLLKTFRKHFSTPSHLMERDNEVNNIASIFKYTPRSNVKMRNTVKRGGKKNT